jgi:hypothetical protein
MRTHARRFRSIFHRHPSLPSRPMLPRDPVPVVLSHLAERSAEVTTPASRVKAWLRVGAHSLLALLWVVLPQFLGQRGRESEPLVVEVERPCACERVGPSLRESLAPRDDAALDRDDADAPGGRAPAAARGFCASDGGRVAGEGAGPVRAFTRKP